MPDTDKHEPGTFCWMELATTDRSAGVDFYRQIFGWSTFDVPMEHDTYTILKLKDRDTGGSYTLTDDMRQRGVPPHWQLYVAVESADETASRVEPAGGTIIAAPFDVPNVGRMAFLRDPQGAVLALFQAREHPGLGITNEPGALIWSELNTSDAAGALEFYGKVFGWGHKTDTPGSPKAYTEWKVGDRSVGGMMQIQPEWGPVPPHWMPYIQVEDCDAMVTQAEKLGATTIVPPMDIPEVGRFSTIRDPQGAHFSIFRSGRAG